MCIRMSMYGIISSKKVLYYETNSYNRFQFNLNIQINLIELLILIEF